MKEIDRIDKNTNGELPQGQKTIIRVTDIEDPKTVLNNCKKAIKVFLENSSLDRDSSKWLELMPANMVSFEAQLDDYDYSYDLLLYPWRIIINDLTRIKNWEWFSSKLLDNGFEIVTTQSCSDHFFWFIHYQQIPYNKMYVMNDQFGDYVPSTLKDVMSYKKFE